MTRRRGILSRRFCEFNPHYAAYTGQNSLPRRTHAVIGQLCRAGRGLKARAIRLGDGVRKQLKTWTLRRMERQGLILRRGRPGFYIYELTERGQEIAEANSLC